MIIKVRIAGNRLPIEIVSTHQRRKTAGVSQAVVVVFMHHDTTAMKD